MERTGLTLRSGVGFMTLGEMVRVRGGEKQGG